MFAFQDSRGPVDVGFTDRHGGVSEGPYSSLNLAESGGDDSERVAENVRRVTAAFTGGTTDPAGAPSRLVRMRQVHGADVHVVDEAYLDAHLDAHRQATEPPPIVADAVVTKLRDVTLMVRVADCVPLLLADPDRAVVAAAHAGRPGMVAGIVPHTVAAMRDLGAERITAWVGPHVCGRCYEVPAAMRDEVTAAVPEAFAETSWGTPAVDIGRGVHAQLAHHDVAVVDASRCTIEDDDLFSYRRQGQRSGRLAGLVRIRP